ncbi:MAG: hypothetical protein O2971_08185 [Proteobacteria bacterium]|nr:hypothetical protein [Pseudomonadota bacterium]
MHQQVTGTWVLDISFQYAEQDTVQANDIGIVQVTVAATFFQKK